MFRFFSADSVAYLGQPTYDEYNARRSWTVK
jgi:hypothetical protein